MTIAMNRKGKLLEEREFTNGYAPGMDRAFYCYFCIVELQPMTGKLFKFLLDKDMAPSHALDLFYRCPKCGLDQSFGIVLSKEQFEESRKYSRKMASDK